MGHAQGYLLLMGNVLDIEDDNAMDPVKTEKMTRLGIEPRPFWTYTSSSNQLSYQVLLGSSW